MAKKSTRCTLQSQCELEKMVALPLQLTILLLEVPEYCPEVKPRICQCANPGIPEPVWKSAYGPIMHNSWL